MNYSGWFLGKARGFKQRGEKRRRMSAAQTALMRRLICSLIWSSAKNIRGIIDQLVNRNVELSATQRKIASWCVLGETTTQPIIELETSVFFLRSKTELRLETCAGILISSSPLCSSNMLKAVNTSVVSMMNTCDKAWRPCRNALSFQLYKSEIWTISSMSLPISDRSHNYIVN